MESDVLLVSDDFMIVREKDALMAWRLGGFCLG